MKNNPTDKESLIAACLAGEAVAENLLTLCRDDAAFASELAGHIEVDRLLHLNAAGEDDERFVSEVAARLQCEGDERFVGAVTQQIQGVRKKGAVRFWRYAAAALMAIALTGWFLRSLHTPECAVVAQQTSAVWAGAVYSTGDAVRRGELTLAEGYAELMLDCGVRLILEAPVTVDLTDPRRVVLKSGSLVANVPRQAVGFTVLTPSSEVVDLGTEFGVAVDAHGGSEVCVLEGEVKARGSSSQEFVTMVKDEACSFDVHRQITMIRSDPARFVRALPGGSVNDPHYLHWSFDGAGARAKCGGTGIQGRFYDGELKAFRSGEGPVYQSGQFGQALYFNGTDAYVDTGFPGIGGNAPRTVAFWTKVPQGDIEHSGYAMISWGLMQPGAAWQISANPEPREGPLGRIRVGTKIGMVIGTQDLRDGRWHHIAIVMYGGDAADTSTHILIYVDGQLEKTSRKSIACIATALDDRHSQQLRFGRNLEFREDSQPVSDKFFNGWLDEIYIFDAALEQAQIERLMKKNEIF